MQSSCNRGTATPGMAAASIYGKARSSTERQLTPTIASILPVWMSDMTMADPSATSTATRAAPLRFANPGSSKGRIACKAGRIHRKARGICSPLEGTSVEAAAAGCKEQWRVTRATSHCSSAPRCNRDKWRRNPASPPSVQHGPVTPPPASVGPSRIPLCNSAPRAGCDSVAAWSGGIFFFGGRNRCAGASLGKFSGAICINLSCPPIVQGFDENCHKLFQQCAFKLLVEDCGQC